MVREPLLMGRSVQPLLALMREKGVTRVESATHDWFLDQNRTFRNQRSDEQKEGNIADLQRPGSVFNYTNTSINP